MAAAPYGMTSFKHSTEGLLNPSVTRDVIFQGRISHIARPNNDAEQSKARIAVVITICFAAIALHEMAERPSLESLMGGVGAIGGLAAAIYYLRHVESD